MIKSSGSKGICYVETKNLDGETNLKHKVAPKELQTLIEARGIQKGFKGRITCEEPND